MWNTFKTVGLGVDVEKFRTITVNIAKTHILLVKKETSNVLSSNIVWHGWKVIYVLKLKCKNALFWEINFMKIERNYRNLNIMKIMKH